MLAVLALSLAIRPPADHVVCPAPAGRSVGIEQRLNEALGAPWDEGAFGALESTPTEVADGMALPDTTAGWFAGRTIGTGEWAVYDAARQTFAACIHYQRANGLVVWRLPAAQVPLDVPRHQFRFASERGVAIGSTLARVRSIYGDAALQSAGGLEALQYERRGPDTLTTTVFVFRAHTLVGIHRLFTREAE
jgi:hypothetical protein